MFYVYLLKSLKDNNYYIGQTDNIKNRLDYHNDGKVKSTKNRIPFILIGTEEYPTRNESRWREYTLKNNANERRKFINKFSPKP
ncbi:MAG TPA: GIY-YIG nuclease family protein [Candidatus Portnoybacteria bacterium]|nr:GIY-YIG nuclease family protein [Candidatus Portnoybacteria bacterium]MDD5752246.1 GIY-YIG nuclease family protein [Candidatus Portnoybacteria bacterium]HNU96745.1 GIY-YIG nuclease family protein [Candidatus Portnoybacteria bacterium]HOZ16527.1 GIY-YIG nuclease family protein [Candidatus Portnoybacteria bacterium]HPH52286.1 GIY-YIG nuclease family protein [Candidatus Portnoybacteria bacterium]